MANIEDSIQLGDIIRVKAPKNDLVHNGTFFVQYCDIQSQVDLIHIESFQLYEIKMKNGSIVDKTIEKLIVVSRSTKEGFAMQNGLFPNSWVELEFESDIRAIITAKVVSVEEDMVEFISYPEKQPFFIDFAYKGIPKDIPLKNICFTDVPGSYVSEHTKRNEDDNNDEDNDKDFGDIVTEYNEFGEMTAELPEEFNFVTDYRVRLQKEYNDEEEEEEEEEDDDYMNDLPVAQLRFTLEAQVNDLLDDLLADVPDAKRTHRVMKQIHTHVNRFKELREEFSVMDHNNQIQGFVKKDYNTYRSLHKDLNTLNTNVSWFIPVANVKKEAYTLRPKKENDEPDDTELYDNMHEITLLNEDKLDQNISQENQHYLNYWDGKKYTGNDTQYQTYYQKYSSNSLTPYDSNRRGILSHLAEDLRVGRDIDMFLSYNTEITYPTVYGSKFSKSNIKHTPFVMQRFVGPIDYIHKTKFNNEFRPLMHSDNVDLHSIVVLPEKYVFQDSLKHGNILHMSQYQHPYIHQIVQHYKKVIEEVNLDDDDDNNTNTETCKGGIFPHKSALTHIVVNDERIQNSSEPNVKYQFLLKQMLPNLFSLMNCYYQLGSESYNPTEYLQKFASYGVNVRELSFTSFKKIRYHINNNIRNYKDELIKLNENYPRYILRHFKRKPTNNVLYLPFMTKFSSLSKRGEGLTINDVKFLKRIYQLFSVRSNSETLSKLIRMDNAKLWCMYVLFNNKELITPLVMTTANVENKLFYDASKKTLSKTYTSLVDLQKDNNVRGLKYDEKHDANDYAEMKRFQKEKSQQNEGNFKSFVEKELANVYGCSVENVEQLATELIQGYKEVREGDYAVLEISPKLPQNVNECDLNDNEKNNIEIEAKIRKIERFFKRINHVWVYDANVGKDSFEKPKNLTCHLTKSEPKPLTNQFVPKENRINTDFTKRNEELYKPYLDKASDAISRNLQVLKRELETKLLYMKTVKETENTKYDKYHYRLGESAFISETIPSPLTKLLQNINYKGRDFAEKQNNIIEFVQKNLRDAIGDESKDWKYCKETSSPILATSVFELAYAFNKNKYNYVFQQLINMNIIVKSDGKFIDKKTGVIFDEIEISDANFEMQDDVVDTDSFEIDSDHYSNIYTEENGGRVYSDVNMQKAYSYMTAICKNLYIRPALVEESTMELCFSFLNKNDIFLSESKFENTKKEQEKKEESQRDKTYKQSYEQYFTMRLFYVLVGCLIVSVQCLIPNFKPRKTFGDCVIDLNGYPLDENAGNDGTIEYFSCILIKMKGDKKSIPWGKISKTLTSSKIKSGLKIVLGEDKVKQLYERKREFLRKETENPLTIGEKWVRFLPPIHKLDVNKGLKHLEKSVREELEKSLKKGHKNQWHIIGMFFGKMFSFSFGLLQVINEIIQQRGTLLGKVGQKHLIENACCNEKNMPHIPIDYFAKIEEMTVLTYLKDVGRIGNYLYKLRAQTRAPTMYKEPTRTTEQQMIRINDFCNYSEYLMYKTMINYCNLDSLTRQVPFYLHAYLSEKPDSYDPKQSLEEKIQTLKEANKSLNMENFSTFMKLVYKKNKVEIHNSIQISQNETNLDNMNVWSNHTNSIIAIEIVEKMEKLFDPSKNETPNTSESQYDDLNDTLHKETEKMETTFRTFMDDYGTTSSKKEEMLKMLEFPNTIDIVTQGQFLKNYLYYLSTTVYSYLVRKHITLNERSMENAKKLLLHDDYSKVQSSIKEKEEYLQDFEDDPIITIVISELKSEFMNLYRFFSKYQSFFDAKHISLYRRFFRFVLFYIFNSFIDSSLNQDIVKMIVQKKSQSSEAEDQMEEVNIEPIDKTRVRERVSSFIQSLLDKNTFYGINKQKFVVNYETIQKNVEIAEEKEKMGHKLAFEKIKDNKTRKAERELEKYHLGRFHTDVKVLKKYGKRRDEMINVQDTEEDYQDMEEDEMAVMDSLLDQMENMEAIPEEDMEEEETIAFRTYEEDDDIGDIGENLFQD